MRIRYNGKNQKEKDLEKDKDKSTEIKSATYVIIKIITVIQSRSSEQSFNL